MSYGTPTKFGTTALQCDYDSKVDGSLPSPKVTTTAGVYNPGIFKQGGEYYLFCNIIISGEARGVDTDLYLARNGINVQIDGVSLYSESNPRKLADTNWTSNAYYIYNIGSTLRTINIDVYARLQSANAVETAESTARCNVNVALPQIQYMRDIVFVSDASVSPGDVSTVSALLCLPEGGRKVIGQVIHIKSTNTSKKIILSSVDGTPIDANTYDFTFSQTATYSNTALTQISATILVMNEGLAAMSVVYDGTTWRVLSYYNGLPISPWIAWGNLLTTTNTITERVVAVDLSTKTGNYLLNLPDPAGPLKEVIVLAVGDNTKSVGLCRGTYSLDNNINAILYIRPATTTGNACVRILSNGTMWYVLSMFDGNTGDFTILTDSSTVTPTTTVPSPPGIISLTASSTVDTPITVPADGKSYLYHLKARFTSSSELVLTSKTNGGRICGTSAVAIKSAAKLCPCVIFIDQLTANVRYYYIVSFFCGY